MSIEVLVATMGQSDHSLPKKMNLETNAIITNQASKFKYEEFDYNNHKIKFFTFDEVGVGLNRNNALMRASADISILADDDLVFYNGYKEKVEKVFSQNPEADVIIFNLDEEVVERYVIKNKFKVNRFNYMRFGAARIAFRTRSVTLKGISFNLHFGGGTEYSAGEDVLFLNSCLNKNLNIIAVPEVIAKLTDNRESTWFKGYTDKFFIDKGVLFTAISNKFAYLLCLQYCLRHRKKFAEEKTWLQAFKLTKLGIKEYRSK